MTVKCHQLINSITGEIDTSSPWLTIGKTYVVLAVLCEPGRDVLFRLIGDDERTPGLFGSRLFTCVDSQLPLSWGASLSKNGAVELAPEEWLAEGFWEDYFNGVREAEIAFEKGMAAILGTPHD